MDRQTSYVGLQIEKKFDIEDEISYTYNQQIKTPLHLLMIYGF